MESIQTHDVPSEYDIMIVGVCPSYDIQDSRKKDMTSEISIGKLLFVILELRSMLEVMFFKNDAHYIKNAQKWPSVKKWFALGGEDNGSFKISSK